MVSSLSAINQPFAQEGSPAAMSSSNITPIQAASDGGTITESAEAPASPARPERGIARVRDSEVYSLTVLVRSALYEAEHIIDQVNEKARDRYLDHEGTTEPLNSDEISRLLGEAYQCATLASTYIDKAAMGLLDSSPEAPWG
jgi:hypothetical protein